MTVIRGELVECVGGPCDGAGVELVRGACVFRMRMGAVWHSYRLQPTDCGMLLVYTGPFYADQPEAADLAS